MTGRYEQLEHTADLALRVVAASIEALFATAARAMFSQLADPALVAPSARHEVDLEAPDQESLLVEWLNELLYLHETLREVYVEFAFDELSATRLRATITGGEPAETFDIIKGATYHDLSIQKTEDGLAATIVFDV
jgi:SHS2 domain-containing protein